MSGTHLPTQNLSRAERNYSPRTELGIGGGEINPEIAQACLRPESLSTMTLNVRRQQLVGRSIFLNVAQYLLALTATGKKERGALLDTKAWLAVAMTTSELFIMMSSDGFWLTAVGCKLDGTVMGSKHDVARFSVLALMVRIQKEQAADGVWAKELLCDYRGAYSTESSEDHEKRKQSVVNVGAPETEAKEEASFYTVPWQLSKVVEKRTDDAPLLPLAVCLSEAASVDYFVEKLSTRLEQQSYPTAAQGEEVKRIVAILAHVKGMSAKLIIDGIIKRIPSLDFKDGDGSGCGADLDVARLNTPLCALTARAIAELHVLARKEFISEKHDPSRPRGALKSDTNDSGGDNGNDGDVDDVDDSILGLERLLPRLDAILYCVAAACGSLSVDDFKEDKWSNVRTEWRQPSEYLRRIVVIALANLSPMALLGVLGKGGIWKVIFGKLVRVESTAKKLHARAIRTQARQETTREAVEAAAASSLSLPSAARPLHSILDGLENVVMLCKILHGARYPDDEEAFKRENYGRWVARPLQRILMRDPLFGSAEGSTREREFTNDALFQQHLAKARLPRPIALSPATVMSIGGNTRASWRRLIVDIQQLTSGQVLANLRSLILLDVDPSGRSLLSGEKDTEAGSHDDGAAASLSSLSPSAASALRGSPEAVLLRKPCDAMTALKLRLMLQMEFSPSYVEYIQNAVWTEIAKGKFEGGACSKDMQEGRGGSKNANDLPNNPPPPPAQQRNTTGASLIRTSVKSKSRYGRERAAPGTRTDEVFVTMPETIYRDKSGKLTEVNNRKRLIATSFSAISAKRYIDLLNQLTCQELTQIASPVYTSERSRRPLRAVIALTTELLNTPRSGLPPKIPSYTETSLWRNECVCLQDLFPAAKTASFDGAEQSKNECGEAGKQLLFGIHWCEDPEGKSNSVDLDASVVAYSEEMEYLYHCDYTKLQNAGLEHSGDYTSAPYPDGARETVTVDVQELDPRVAHLAIVVFAYSGQDMDDLYDASVFVADPSMAGTGPGGTRILTAARLTGKGRCNVSAMLSIDRKLHRQYLTCVDSTMNVGQINAASANGLVASALSRLTLDAAKKEQRLNLAHIAAMQAITMGADEIIVIHGGNDASSEVVYETLIRPGTAIPPRKTSEEDCADTTTSATATAAQQREAFDMHFFEATRARLCAVAPATHVDFHRFGASAVSWASTEDVPAKTVIFCGEIPTCRSVTQGTKMLWSRCAQQFAETMVSDTSADKGKSANTAPTSLAVVNMRSDENSLKEKQVRVSGSGLVDVTVASGVGVLSALVAWARRV